MGASEKSVVNMTQSGVRSIIATALLPCIAIAAMRVTAPLAAANPRPASARRAARQTLQKKDGDYASLHNRRALF
jgi:hypothetical protein